jgi:hypothetical protein
MVVRSRTNFEIKEWWLKKIMDSLSYDSINIHINIGKFCSIDVLIRIYVDTGCIFMYTFSCI